MNPMVIEPGMFLEVVTASGATVRMRALGPVIKGSDFAVVWVTTPEEYERAEAEGDEAEGVPWPLRAVREPPEAARVSGEA